MDWTDEAVVLAARKHGESSAVVQLLTRAHGRHAGLMRGAASKRQRGVAEPGNRVQAAWKARLADHLGMVTLEPVHQTAAGLMTAPRRLAGLASACAIAEAALPEREPHPALYDATVALFSVMEDHPGDDAIWPAYGRSRLVHCSITAPYLRPTVAGLRTLPARTTDAISWQ